jgi:hypothetical protein
MITLPKSMIEFPFSDVVNCASDVHQIFLLGAPYKNAKYSFDSQIQKIGYLDIVFSSGSVERSGDQCTYLGDKRILEMNPIQSKWMLTFTIPLQKGISIGFGFDFNGTIDNSLLVLSNLEIKFNNSVITHPHFQINDIWLHHRPFPKLFLGVGQNQPLVQTTQQSMSFFQEIT